jgi:hypothetical protein
MLHINYSTILVNLKIDLNYNVVCYNIIITIMFKYVCVKCGTEFAKKTHYAKYINK